jgi:AcrR family transcriptional regulator
MSDPVVPAAERSRWNWKRTNQTQRTLLDAALELFIENGYAGTSVEDIVQRSNLSIGSLYHHFGNKAGLYLALWQEWVKDQENLVSTAIEDLQSRGEAGTVPLFMVGARLPRRMLEPPVARVGVLRSGRSSRIRAAAAQRSPRVAAAGHRPHACVRRSARAARCRTSARPAVSRSASGRSL